MKGILMKQKLFALPLILGLAATLAGCPQETVPPEEATPEETETPEALPEVTPEESPTESPEETPDS